AEPGCANTGIVPLLLVGATPMVDAVTQDTIRVGVAATLHRPLRNRTLSDRAGPHPFTLPERTRFPPTAGPAPPSVGGHGPHHDIPGRPAGSEASGRRPGDLGGPRGGGPPLRRLHGDRRRPPGSDRARP